MSTEPNVPHQGDAAWKAAKQRVADNNNAAYSRGRKERAARDAAALAERRAADRREAASLPTPPRERPSA